MEKAGLGNLGNARRLVVRRAPYLLAQARPAMLIDKILARGGVCIVAAPPYAGKTFLALEAMRALGEGKPFLGHFAVPAPGNALYLGNDSPAWDIASQFDKLIGLPDPVTEDVSWLVGHTALGSYGFIFDPAFTLDTAVAAEAVVDAARSQWSMRDYTDHGDHESYRGVGGTDLIVLDTLRSLHGFDENNNTMMQHAMNLLRHIAVSSGAAVIALHHFNKPAKDSQQSALDRLRGATAIGGAADSVFALTGKWPSLAVRVLKHRVCPEQGDFMYKVIETPDGLEMRVAADGGVVNLTAQAEILALLTEFAGQFVKSRDIVVRVGEALKVDGKKAENAANGVLRALEKDGRVIRVHGAARLADIQPRATDAER